MPRGHLAVDLTGQRFGRLLVKHRGANDHRGHAVWRCLCDCGKFVETRASSLRRGVSRSCGCLSRYTTIEARRPSPGDIFGLLTVREFSGVKNHKSVFICDCACGSVVEIRATNLRSGNSRSCGCGYRNRAPKDAALFRQIDQLVAKQVDICSPVG